MSIEWNSHSHIILYQSFNTSFVIYRCTYKLKLINLSCKLSILSLAKSSPTGYSYTVVSSFSVFHERYETVWTKYLIRRRLSTRLYGGPHCQDKIGPILRKSGLSIQ